METVKKYEVTDFEGNEVHFEVDHSVLTTDNATEINDFWSGADERLDDAEGDVVKAVLKHAFQVVIALMHRHGWDSVNKKQSDSFTSDFHSEEGWFECGIKVTYASLVQSDLINITVRCLS